MTARWLEIEIGRLALNTPVHLDQGPSGIVVIRTERGVVAYEDVCPHHGWQISSGDVRNGEIECPGHGWTFRLDTGACSSTLGYGLRSLRVVTCGASVRIEYPEPRPPRCSPCDASLTTGG